MNPAAETVVLVHGLWMHGLVFGLLRRRLERSGFVTHAWSYPSVRQGLSANADALARFLAGLQAGPIHLVGHSLGGIVIASALARHPDPRVRRVVLMGPPWTGSRSATELRRVPGIAALIGRSMRDWLPAPRPALPGVELGVISGSRPLGLAGALVRLPHPNDGIVTVEETRVAGARDAVTLHVSHMEMLLSAPCASQVATFLHTGAFIHDQPKGPAGQGVQACSGPRTTIARGFFVAPHKIFLDEIARLATMELCNAANLPAAVGQQTMTPPQQEKTP